MYLLTDGMIRYAAHRDRGEYRGFAALHDLMDANTLLPGVDDIATNLDLLNAIVAEVSRQILDHPHAGLEHPRLRLAQVAALNATVLPPALWSKVLGHTTEAAALEYARLFVNPSDLPLEIHVQMGEELHDNGAPRRIHTFRIYRTDEEAR